jgi:lysophospholipase L1-like esterase
MLDADVALAPTESAMRVAFLGDSYLEGTAVPPGTRLTEILEQTTPGQIEALNFGLSGTGTLDQLALYRRLVRPLSPGLVILMIYPGNDIVDNSTKLAASIGARPQTVSGASAAQPKTWIRSIAPSLYAHMYVARKRVAQQHVGPASSAAHSEPVGSYLDVYRPPELPADSLWRRAWALTEATILALSADVARDSANLLVVILPDPIQPYSGDAAQLERILGRPLPAGFDPYYPSNRLADFLSETGIASLNLADVFKDYAEVNGLSAPYFGFESDGHWDTLGHQVAAEAVLQTMMGQPACSTPPSCSIMTLPSM